MTASPSQELTLAALVTVLWHAARRGGDRPDAREWVHARRLVEETNHAIAAGGELPSGSMASDVLAWLEDVRTGVQSLRDVGWDRGRGNVPKTRKKSWFEVDQVGGGKVLIPPAMYFADLVGEAKRTGATYADAARNAVLAMSEIRGVTPRTIQRQLQRYVFEFAATGTPVSAHKFTCRTRHD